MVLMDGLPAGLPVERATPQAGLPVEHAASQAGFPAKRAVFPVKPTTHGHCKWGYRTCGDFKSL